MLFLGSAALIPHFGGDRPAWFVLLYAFASAAWWLLLKSNKTTSIRLILLLAIGLRLPMFTVSPQLSGDLFRYRWDGLVATAGISPYAFAPDAPELAFLRDEWHVRINHATIPTIYPPVAEVLFFLWALAGGSILLWRLILLVADLLLIRWLSSAGDARVAFAWATCPLVLVEGISNGHVDLLAAAALFASWRRVHRDKPISAGAMACAAASIKLVPLVALPALLRWTRGRARFLSGFLVTACVTSVPFLLTGPFMPGFGVYASRWSFNSPAHAALVFSISRSRLDRLARALWSSIKDPLGLESISPWMYRQLHPEEMTRAFLMIVLLVVLVAIARRARSAPWAIGASLGALLLLSPTIHPWYWLSVLPFALAAHQPILVLVAVASPASYLLYDDPRLAPVVVLLCYGAPLTVALGPRLYRATSDLRLRLISVLMASRGDSPS